MSTAVRWAFERGALGGDHLQVGDDAAPGSGSWTASSGAPPPPPRAAWAVASCSSTRSDASAVLDLLQRGRAPSRGSSATTLVVGRARLVGDRPAPAAVEDRWPPPTRPTAKNMLGTENRLVSDALSKPRPTRQAQRREVGRLRHADARRWRTPCGARPRRCRAAAPADRTGARWPGRQAALERRRTAASDEARGARPTSTAIACSVCARDTRTSIACARVTSSCVSACATSARTRRRRGGGSGSAPARARTPHRRIEQLLLGVQAAQREVVRRQLGVQRQPHRRRDQPPTPARPRAPPRRYGERAPTRRPRTTRRRGSMMSV